MAEDALTNGILDLPCPDCERGVELVYLDLHGTVVEREHGRPGHAHDDAHWYCTDARAQGVIDALAHAVLNLLKERTEGSVGENVADSLRKLAERARANLTDREREILDTRFSQTPKTRPDPFGLHAAVDGLVEAFSDKRVITEPGGETMALWVWTLQKALPDDCEDWLPRDIRCPWCGARFNGGWHEKECPLREVDRKQRGG